MPSYGTEYRSRYEKIKNKCKWAKEEWFNEKYAELERISITEKADMYNNIKEPTG